MKKNNEDIANHFNKYFVNVGKNLANAISHPGNTVNTSFIDINCQTIFIKATTEKEITDIVLKT